MEIIRDFPKVSLIMRWLYCPGDHKARLSCICSTQCSNLCSKEMWYWP